MSKEDQALKQAAKAEKRDNKDANAAVVAAKQAEKALKQSGKQADRELRAEKDRIKSDNQVKSRFQIRSAIRIFFLSFHIRRRKQSSKPTKLTSSRVNKTNAIARVKNQ